MCYSPVRIRNKKHGFNPAVDREFNVVPCNHCGECMADKRTQYFIRSLCETEFMYLRKSKQIVPTKDVMFCTLTYDNKNLPVLTFPDGKKRSVFRYEDIQEFFNRLESHYYRRGITFHYLICSEYGHGDIYTDRHGRKRVGTFRPHYHLLLFFDTPIDSLEFKNVICKMWTCGKSLFGELGEPRVGSQGALRYVTKYVTKFDYSTEFFRDFMADYDENSLTSELMLRMRTHQYYGDVLEKLSFLFALKSSMPRCRSSLFFGLGITRSNKVVFDDKKKLVFYFNEEKNDYVQYKLPLYYRKRFDYDLNLTKRDDYTYKLRFNKDKSFNFKKNYKYESVSTIKDSALKKRYAVIDEVFKETTDRLKGDLDFISLCAHSNTFKDWSMSPQERCLLPFLTSIDCNKLAFYVMFNRGFSEYIDTDIHSAFIVRHYPDYSIDYVNLSYVEFYEKVLDLLFTFNAFCGKTRDKVFQEKYKQDKVKRAYRNNYY